MNAYWRIGETPEPKVQNPMTDAQAPLHRVVIVGAGFGGLQATHQLKGAPVRITLVDRRNHHLFQPLLYQVATASLATSEIAWPIRYLLRDRPEVTTLFANVVGVDAANKRVLLDDGDTLPYDTLVLATGARHAYFGHDEWEPFAPGLKTLEDATTLRRRILVAFERAERETDSLRRAALLTFVIVGAGPTGVELAGTIAELARDTLPPDFRNIDTQDARVVLIEAGPRVLAGFPDDLSAYAQRSLESLGVEVVLGQPVTECSVDGVVYGGSKLPAKTLIWAAGVRASSAAEWLGAASRPRLPPAGRTRPHRAGPSRHLRDRRYRHDQRPRRQAGARHCAGGQAAGGLRRQRHQGAAARRNDGPVPLPARRQSRADRQAQGGDRFRALQIARHHRVVDLGHRPHLFPDRPAQPAQRRDLLALDPRPRPARRPADHAGLKQGGEVRLLLLFESGQGSRSRRASSASPAH